MSLCPGICRSAQVSAVLDCCDWPPVYLPVCLYVCLQCVWVCSAWTRPTTELQVKDCVCSPVHTVSSEIGFQLFHRIEISDSRGLMSFTGFCLSTWNISTTFRWAVMNCLVSPHRQSKTQRFSLLRQKTETIWKFSISSLYLINKWLNDYVINSLIWEIVGRFNLSPSFIHVPFRVNFNNFGDPLTSSIATIRSTSIGCQQNRMRAGSEHNSRLLTCWSLCCQCEHTVTFVVNWLFLPLISKLSVNNRRHVE